MQITINMGWILIIFIVVVILSLMGPDKEPEKKHKKFSYSLTKPAMPSIKKPRELHWYLFAYNPLYFIITLIPVAIYLIARYTWYKSQGKNFFGQTPEEQRKEQLKEIAKDLVADGFWTDWPETEEEFLNDGL